MQDKMVKMERRDRVDTGRDGEGGSEGEGGMEGRTDRQADKHVSRDTNNQTNKPAD